MTRTVKNIFLLLIALPLITCKKKTSVKVTVYNYALSEPIANATVVLVEKKGDSGGIFGGNATCNEIANATTNSNGECNFDNEKFRSSSKYDYFLGVTNAYGIPDTYPCGGKASGFLLKGKTQEVILNASYYNGFIKVQENNLLNPSQAGDTLSIRITSAYYSVPDQPFPFGGGGVLLAEPYYGCNGFPFPSVVFTNVVETQCGKKVVKIRKIKMGIVTSNVDTVKVYPNQTTVVQVNW